MPTLKTNADNRQQNGRATGHATDEADAAKPQELRIAVIGGGLGGLSFALACHRIGIEVDVYEQAREFREIGNGVSLQRNASILVNDFLQLEKEYAAIAAPSAASHIDFRNGKTGEIQESLSHPAGPVKGRVHRVKRCDYLDMVRASLPPGKLHVRKRLVRLVKHGDVYTISFEDGTHVEADVTVAADGIHSPSRRILQQNLGLKPDQPVFSGQKVYRALIPKTAFNQDEQDLLFTGSLNNFRGHDRHVLAGATGPGGKEINIVAFIPEMAAESESWTARGEVSMLKEELKDWCQPVRRIVEEMGKLDPQCLKQALYYRKPLERWTDGALVLLGDAAHPILPHQGSGTGMAIEDAIALALLLHGATKQNVASRLEGYEKIRKPRTDAMLLNSIKMGKEVSSSKSADEISDKQRSMMTDRSFIWNYDARVEAQKELQKLENLKLESVA